MKNFVLTRLDMKIQKITLMLIAAGALTLSSSCGSNDNAATEQVQVADPVATDPVDYDFGSQKLSKSQMDSLSNHPDEMSASEAAGALVYLYRSVEQSSGTKRLIAIRKFMDFYNIVLDNHGNDLRSSLAKVKKKQDIDLAKVYEEYASAMSGGDEGGATVADIKVDTIRTVSNNETTVTTVAAEEAVINTVGE